MIERIVQKVLTAAVAAIRADTSILDSIFQPDDDDIRISAAELVKIKADFVALNGAVPRFKVRSGYAVNENHVPSFSVVLQNERQAHRALGDYVGDAEDSTTHALLDPAVELIGSIEDRTIAVLAYGWTPDECYWYYKILKAIILLNLSVLRSYTILDVGYSGQDLQPVQAPPHLFWLRSLNLSTQVEEYVRVSTGLQRIQFLDLRRSDSGGVVDTPPPWV